MKIFHTLSKITKLAVVLLLITSCTTLSPAISKKSFNGGQAYEFVSYQVSLGPRIPGSKAHSQVIDWIDADLEDYGWQVEIQESSKMGHPISNVIGKKGSGKPWLILGAHYDSRLVADKDPNPDHREKPVPGANDGASGVAVLLELARLIDLDQGKGQIWLVFFDAEDNGNIPGWDWILGSRAMAESLDSKPDAVVVLDMIGDQDLNIFMERNSTPDLTKSIWDKAEQLGYSEQFIPQFKYSILDDHTPFLQAGIPAADVIDFDYPYWHTTQDTLDKVSPDSLKIVGDTIYQWSLDFFD